MTLWRDYFVIIKSFYSGQDSVGASFGVKSVSGTTLYISSNNVPQSNMSITVYYNSNFA